MASRPTIFLSYTRRDRSGVEAADALESRLTVEGFDVWRDKNRLEAGYSWAPEIEREVERRDVMLAVISPSYRDSDICRAEHVLALRAGRRVIPLLVAPDAPIPLHLINKQYLNVSAFAGLLHALGSDDTTALKPEYQKRRSNVTSDRRPERFVPRPAELDALKRLILSEDSSRTTSIIGVRGQGGIGKTVLAAELARDRAIEAAFPDGIVWLPIGREPRELPKFLKEAARILGDGSGDYSTELAACNSFRECVRDKAALLVLDNIWEPRHVRPFLPLDDADAPRLRLVCTTRKPSVTSSLCAREHLLGTLPPPLAHQLLAEWLNCNAADLPPQAQIILDHCHGHPLALNQIGSLLAQKIRNWGQEEGWDYVLQWLKKLPFDPELKSVMETSLAALPNEVARERYLDLAVFPDETPIPFSVLPIYWQTTKFDAQDTVDAWLDLSLVEKSKDNRLILHDLQLDYVKAQRESPALHGKLVDAATDDDYFLARLPYHLKHAGREAEVEALLMDPDWLRKKLERLGTTAVRADFGYASSEACSILAHTLDLSSHVLSRDPDQLAFQLYGRLLDQRNAEIRNLLQVLEPELALRPLRRCLDGPDIFGRNLRGHSGPIVSVAVTPDGARAVSGSSDETLILWDLHSGNIERRLQPQLGVVARVDVTPDSTQAVCEFSNNMVLVWNLHSGATERRLSGHSGRVAHITTMPDAVRIASESADNSLPVRVGDASWFAITQEFLRWVSADDETLRVLDFSFGTIESDVECHSGAVTSLAPSPDGLRAISGSNDGKLILWDVRTACVERHLEGHSGGITSLAVTRDGTRAISASDDTTLIVWNLRTGEIERNLIGHSGAVLSVTVTRDGARAVSASDDNTLIVWDLSTGGIERRLEGHSSAATSVAVTRDGSLAISGSHDNTLVVWDLRSGGIKQSLKSPSGTTLSVVETQQGVRDVSVYHDLALIVRQPIPERIGRGSRRGAVGLKSYSNVLILWDPLSGRIEQHLLNGTGEVSSVTITPDGACAIAGSSDRTLTLWSLVEDRCLGTFTMDSPIRAVCADAQYVIAGDARGTVHFFELSK